MKSGQSLLQTLANGYGADDKNLKQPQFMAT